MRKRYRVVIGLDDELQTREAGALRGAIIKTQEQIFARSQFREVAPKIDHVGGGFGSRSIRAMLTAYLAYRKIGWIDCKGRFDIAIRIKNGIDGELCRRACGNRSRLIAGNKIECLRADGRFGFRDNVARDRGCCV